MSHMFVLKTSSVLSILTLVLILIYVFGIKYKLHLELQRKLLHIALGLVSLSFPLIFNHTWEVAVLMLISFLVLLSLHYIPLLRKTLGESVYGVNRSWAGGTLFAAIIVVLFYASHNNYALYAGPLLVVTFSDAFAAIIGVQYGKKHYTIFGSQKSVEGTLSFFVTAFCSTFLLLLTQHYSILRSAHIAILVAFSTTLTELISGKALDNITIPTITFVLLHYLLG